MSRKPFITEANSGPAPEPAAADELDAAVHQILQKLKEGKAVRLPGLGTLRPGPEKSGSGWRPPASIPPMSAAAPAAIARWNIRA